MTDPARLDRKSAEWDVDPEYIVEGVVIRTNERICELMETRGITRAELARRLRKSPPYVTRLLNGRPNMTLRTLTEIAVALGEAIEVFIPSSVRQQRRRALEAHLAEQRAQQVVVGQARWRDGKIIVRDGVQRTGVDDGRRDPVSAAA
jgi:transcriptional regulator with XRE-family HTH domain